jgi:hypothetical protein
MASKIQERIYAEKAKELLGWDCQFNEIPGCASLSTSGEANKSDLP